MPTLQTTAYSLDEPHPQARVCARCEMRHDALFGALDAESLERVHLHIASPTLPAGERLYVRGELGAAVFTIRSGIVRFERITEGGERRIVRLAGRGDLVGAEALLRRAYDDDAVCCTTVELCRIPQTLIGRLGQSEAALLRELMNRWQQALDASQAWSAELSAGPALRRMLKLLRLLQHHADEQGLVWLPRRDEMGDMLDLTIETASRLVSRLRREGVIDPVPPRHARLDEGRLQAALGAIDA